jgi:23S rRNA pseudouridine2457 synthase|tara:strand:+ start:1048 stop:1578 length:531 start_codon:yes stop_codon:yes gene_type:complete
LIIFNKPFQVLCQFTDEAGRKTLADYVDVKEVYPAGRLDFDSEGLLLLTDDGKLQAKISHPKNKLPKTYWAQVEGIASQDDCDALIAGVQLKDGIAKAISCKILSEPDLWERIPPIRVRKSIPDSWIELVIDEGRNRQVRRMTAAVNLPTLRLVRVAIGKWSLGDLQPGQTNTIGP